MVAFLEGPDEDIDTTTDKGVGEVGNRFAKLARSFCLSLAVIAAASLLVVELQPLVSDVVGEFKIGDVSELFSSSPSSFLGTDAEPRQLMKNTDRNHAKCFERKNKLNYWARNPWNRDKVERGEMGDRGDWAKCLPSPSFAMMCIHAESHGMNPDPLEQQPIEDSTSKKWRFQKHDSEAGVLYETLQDLHEHHCAHVELEMTPRAKDAFDQYIKGTGSYAWYSGAEAEPEPEPEPEPKGTTSSEPEPEPEPKGTTSSEPEPEPEPKVSTSSEPEPEPEPASTTTTSLSVAEPEPEPEPEPFTKCNGVNFLKIKDKRSRLRKSLFCAFQTVSKQEFQQESFPGRNVCGSMFGLQHSSITGWGGSTMCPEDGGQACGIHPFELGGHHRRRSASDHATSKLTCKQFCTKHGHECQRAELTNHRQCEPVRTWDCSAKPPDSSRGKPHSGQYLKCTCIDEKRQVDSRINARPLMLPSVSSEDTCKKFQKVKLHVDVQAHHVVVNKREQVPEPSNDFNDVGGYELCDGVELTPPDSPNHCSTGNRIGGLPSKPCLMRLEQLTYDEASGACKARGGQLANVKSVEELKSLVGFSDRKPLGIGLRDQGADDWRFDGKGRLTAQDAMEIFTKAYGQGITRTGCIRLNHDKKGKVLLASLDCGAKSDWVCEGTTDNTLSPLIPVSNDLKADEGAFCLWDLKEPVDSLPNDEGTNFRNTDLACSLQVSSRSTTQCAFDPSSRRRGLSRKRGDRDNAANYPVKGSAVGWKDAAANETFLALDDANDYFHCHYSPSNSGLLRMFALQHMYERNYPGALKRKCGCGYKFMSNLVSRCDCTRSGKADNGCAKWHQTLLTRATKDQPVRCNNCNNRDNL